MEKETKLLIKNLNRKKKEIDFLLDVSIIVNRLEENQRALEEKYKENNEVLIKNKDDINKLKSYLQEQILDL